MLNEIVYLRSSLLEFNLRPVRVLRCLLYYLIDGQYSAP